MNCKVFDLPHGRPTETENMINVWLKNNPGIEIRHSTYLTTNNLLLIFYISRKDKLERLSENYPT